MMEAVMIPESQLGKATFSVGTCKVMDLLCRAVFSPCEIRMGTGSLGGVKDYSGWASLLIGLSFKTVEKLLAGVGSREGVESVGTGTIWVS
jgi:hypothetical protein